MTAGTSSASGTQAFGSPALIPQDDTWLGHHHRRSSGNIFDYDTVRTHLRLGANFPTCQHLAACPENYAIAYHPPVSNRDLLKDPHTTPKRDVMSDKNPSRTVRLQWR